MALNIAVLDCSNYPQLVVVDEQTIEEDRKKWEKDGSDPSRVFEHLQVHGSHGEDAAVDVFASLCKMREMERELEHILGEVFAAGRRFERAYPEGRGSCADKRVYRPDGSEVEFFVSMFPSVLFRKDLTGLAQWIGTAWQVVESISPKAVPVEEVNALYYLQNIAGQNGSEVGDEQAKEALFLKAA